MPPFVHGFERAIVRILAAVSRLAPLLIAVPASAFIPGLVPGEMPGIRSEPLTVLDITVDPPFTPAGRPWLVTLDRPGGRVGRWDCSTISGRCRIGELGPGEHRVKIEDLPGSSWMERWVSVEAGGSTVDVELPIVPIAGRITLGGDPARARMFFRGEDEGQSVELYSDFQGEFHGSLPSEGPWEVTASFWRDGPSTAADKVQVARAPQGEASWIELDLPDTRLQGRVLDAAGRGVDRARVSVIPEDRESISLSTTRTDAEGHFRFRGLAEGDHHVRASGRRTAATSAVFSLRDGELTEVDVRLPGTIHFEGRVSSGGAPVAGAEIHILPELPVAQISGVQRVVTDPLGAFRAELPEGSRGVHLTVLSPGHAASIGRFELVPGEPLHIEMSSWAGDLEIESDEPLIAGYQLEHGAGAQAWLGFLSRWPQLHGIPVRHGSRSWTLPRMAPGPYRFCSPNRTRCATGVLAVDGHLKLTLAPE